MEENELQAELEQLHPASFGWALSCCGHRREEAEDVLQATYLKVLQGTANFDGRSSLRTWLFAVIRRTAIEQRRRRWLRSRLFEQWLAAQPATPSTADGEREASESESRRALLSALAGLSARQREVLHLVFYQDLTVEEASRVLQLSVGTARTHFDRGKHQLRKILAREGVRP